MDPKGTDAGANLETPTDNQEPVVSNHDIKKSDLFTKVTNELAQLQQEKAEREAAEAKALKEQEYKKAQEEGRNSELLKMKDKELEDIQKAHDKKILEMQLAMELAKNGVSNDFFIQGVVGKYDPEKGEVSDYVQSILSDENNMSFLKNDNTRPAKTPPAGVSLAGDTTMSVDQLSALRNSGAPEDRRKALDYTKAYLEKHGKLPGR